MRQKSEPFKAPAEQIASCLNHQSIIVLPHVGNLTDKA